MKRRDFIVLLGLGGASLPTAAKAQKPGPIIGFLNSSSPARFAAYVAAFSDGLAKGGYVEGHNVAIEYRWAENREDQVPALVADLIRKRVAVISGVNTTAAVQAAKAATSEIPIVFSIGGDPVRAGLVASFNRPGGNVTGVSYVSNVLGPKRLELLRELVPNAEAVALLVNPGNPNAKPDAAALQGFGLSVVVAEIRSERDLQSTFEGFVRQNVGGFLIAPDPLFLTLRGRVLELAARFRLPAVFNAREFVDAGGLTSYGPSMAEAYRQTGLYTSRILKGENPADIPILQPTHFETVVNLRVARALGLTIPPSLLARADEVIE